MRIAHTTLAAATLLALASTVQAAPATYQIDPSHTFTHFEVRHFDTSTIHGRFDKKEGSVTIDPQAGTGKASIKVDLTSLNTGVAGLDKHLQGEDFFDVAKFPEMSFEGDQFTFDGDKVKTVAGKLTFHGQTHPVTLTATHYNCYQNPMVKREVCGGDFEATIDRALWGMDYGVKFGQPTAVKLVIQIEAIRQ